MKRTAVNWLTGANSSGPLRTS